MAAKTNDNDDAAASNATASCAPAGVSDELWAESVLGASEYLSVLTEDLSADQHGALTMQYSTFWATRTLIWDRNIKTAAAHVAAATDLRDAYMTFRTAAESTLGSELATEYFGSLDDTVTMATQVEANLTRMLADGELRYDNDDDE